MENKEIVEILTDIADVADMMEDLEHRSHTANIDDNAITALYEAASILRKVESGEYVKLPCKVGTPVFVLTKECELCETMCGDYENYEVLCKDYTIIDSVFLLHMVESFNKTVFLTKESALEALKGAE